MEKRRFPGVHDLLTGRFVRHSTLFYEWRIKDRTEKLEETTDDLDLMNDLAVALDKTGQHQEAIKLMERAMELKPDRYETHANLGTFHIHSGSFEEGLKFIKSAIKINPKAHFGREIVQQLLVEYVLMRKKQSPKGLPLPLYLGGDPHERCSPPFRMIARDLKRWSKIKEMNPTDPFLCPLGLFGFAKFAAAKGLKEEEALKGILGMMKFSNHSHPILLEVLGDILIGDRSGRSKRGRYGDGKRLAARAYLSAAYGTENKTAQNLYRAKAILALTGHRRMNLKKLERSLKRERKRGARWFKRIERNEKRWIRSSKDPEASFDRKYYRKRR